MHGHWRYTSVPMSILDLTTSKIEHLDELCRARVTVINKGALPTRSAESASGWKTPDGVVMAPEASLAQKQNFRMFSSACFGLTLTTHLLERNVSHSEIILHFLASQARIEAF